MFETRKLHTDPYIFANISLYELKFCVFEVYVMGTSAARLLHKYDSVFSWFLLDGDGHGNS